MNHPSHEELAALCRGSLPADREKEIVRHLLFARCAECLAALPPSVSVLLGLAPMGRRRREPEDDAAYDAAIERASARPLALERHLREQRAAAERGAALLAAGRRLPRGMEPLARLWASLDRSWQLRYDDPQAMIQLARNAVRASSRLDEDLYGRSFTTDLRARAVAELGNAYRVANRFADAGRTLADARRLFDQGTGDPALEVRLLELEASLLADLRRFGEALQKLQEMLAFHEDYGDRHLIGATLVKAGLYAGYEGRLELAIRRLEESLGLIDPERDVNLICAAVHNLILFLVDSGRVAEAKRLRLLHGRHLLNAAGRINRIKFRDLEGRIAFAEGRHRQAEAIFREVHEGFAAAGLPALAGLALIDLTAALLRQGKAEEAERAVAGAVALLAGTGIQREALEAVLLLRDACRLRTATVDRVQEAAVHLRRAMFDPRLRLDAGTPGE